MSHLQYILRLVSVLTVPGLISCAGGGSDPVNTEFVPASLDCSIPQSQIFNGGPGKDGIPALTNPVLVGATEPGAAYLRDDDRVIGLDLDGQPVAVPLNIGWWHEVVNLTIDSFSVAVTHCPLTGSSLVFDRRPLGRVEFGVSGLLYQNNLIMYDRSSGESLWPQMEVAARCGPRSGTSLAMVPSIEMRWGAWRVQHPNTFVVGSAQGYDRNYRLYPYSSYDRPDDPSLLFPLPRGIDTRRPPKERVLGIPTTSGGVALPFGELSGLGSSRVVEMPAAGSDVVVFWDAGGEAAMGYHATLDGVRLTFRATPQGVVDQKTGSTWSVGGEGLAGPLKFRRLVPVKEAYVAYWFAWAAFHPSTTLWKR